MEKKENAYKDNVHWVLAHSYGVYFMLFLIGVSLDFIFRVKIFSGSMMVSLGIFIIGLSTLLILWAQNTSRNLKKDNLTKESFCKGPYCYTRSPTHWGLFLLMLGFGIVANAFFVILSTFTSFALTRFFFLEKEEKILSDKYGTPYMEYKKLVKF